MGFGEVVTIVFLGAFGLGFSAMLMEHRQKMAKIRAEGHADSARVEALERRMADLTEVVHQQAIALDDRSALRERVRG